jgi:hypothetical protein
VRVEGKWVKTSFNLKLNLFFPLTSIESRIICNTKTPRGAKYMVRTKTKLPAAIQKDKERDKQRNIAGN